MKAVLSTGFDISCGVPQGSCLGLILFLLYASRLFSVIQHHLPCAHAYADDLQLYLSFKPSVSQSQEIAITAMHRCIGDVRAWMVSNKLVINDKKTEFFIIGSKNQLGKVSVQSITVGSITVKPVCKVRNLGAWLDDNMSMNTHINKTCTKAFKGLYMVWQIRKFLTKENTQTIVHAFLLGIWTIVIRYCVD